MDGTKYPWKKGEDKYELTGSILFRTDDRSYETDLACIYPVCIHNGMELYAVEVRAWVTTMTSVGYDYEEDEEEYDVEGTELEMVSLLYQDLSLEEIESRIELLDRAPRLSHITAWG